MYYRCHNCLEIFSHLKPKLRYPGPITFANVLRVCPKCDSDAKFEVIMVKDLKIFILDDNVTSSNYRYNFGSDLSSSLERSIKKNGLGYILLYKISEFNKVDMNELAMDVLQFIVDTTHPGEKIIFNFKNEIIDLDPSSENYHKLCDQLTELVLSFKKLSHKIVIPYGWREAAGFKDNIPSRIF
jgi:hypothetical protein